jgi:hypothetical protein
VQPKLSEVLVHRRPRLAPKLKPAFLAGRLVLDVEQGRPEHLLVSRRNRVSDEVETLF